MGTTPKYLLPYPELTDPPDGPAQIKALALAIDALDTGWIDLTSVTSFKPNWIAVGGIPVRARKIGKIAFVELTAARTTSTLTADAAGNFTDEQILTIDDPRFRPDVLQYVHGMHHQVGGIAQITSASPIALNWLACTAPNYALPAGAFVRVTTSYATA